MDIPGDFPVAVNTTLSPDLDFEIRLPTESRFLWSNGSFQGFGRETFKMYLQYLVMLESKEVLKEWQGCVRRKKN